MHPLIFLLLSVFWAVPGLAIERAARQPVLYLVGDSTMADKPVIPANAERGWGQMFPAFFKDSIRIENHAVNGRSSKSFLSENRWAAITNKLKPGDWVIIQFGHNDEKKEDPKRYTEPFGEFKTNLARYASETFVRGARPIFATPVVRRRFDTNDTLVDTHGDYVTAVRQAAEENHVPLLNLNARSAEMVKALGPEHSKKLYLWVSPEEFPLLKSPTRDDTHFNAYGATRICDVAAMEILKAAPGLAFHLRLPVAIPAPDPANLSAEER